VSALIPTVGRIVHYVSHGSTAREDGSQVFPSRCQAALVTEVGAWITVDTVAAKSFSRSEGRPIQHAEQWWFDDALLLTVHTASGSHKQVCKHDELPLSGERSTYKPGTWHWPERA